MEFRWTVNYEIDFDIDYVFERIENDWEEDQIMFLEGYTVEQVVLYIIGEEIAGHDDETWFSITKEVEEQICAAVLEKYGAALNEICQRVRAEDPDYED